MFRIRYERWDEALQEYVEVPLDDADEFTLTLAQKLAQVEKPTIEDVRRLIKELSGE